MESVTVRRLVPGDESILDVLARDAPDFDLAHGSEPDTPLSPEAAGRYLANDGIRHWVAEVGGEVVGELLCHAIPLPSGVGGEVLLYAIGVRSRWRRRGIGSLLMTKLDDWMDELESTYVWVLADNPDAVQFYRACGFQPDPEGVGVVMMSRDRPNRQR